MLLFSVIGGTLAYNRIDLKKASYWVIMLCAAAIALVYYFKKFKPTVKGTIAALLVSFAVLGVMMYGIIPGIVIRSEEHTSELQSTSDRPSRMPSSA